MPAARVLTMILAGGAGKRLLPLTVHRCKPAVPFGGNFRLIDFTLMNCIVSDLSEIHLLSQHCVASLKGHILQRWRPLAEETGGKIEILTPPLHTPGGRYKDTADAVYQHLDLLETHSPDVVLILSGDHIYRADYRRLIDAHLERDADLTILTGEADPWEASAFGVVEISRHQRIVRFVEKPSNPSALARRGKCTINLGVYCFSTRPLIKQLIRNAHSQSSHDFGRDICPALIRNGAIIACPIQTVSPDAEPYWRDVGTVDSFYQASMDLLKTPPPFNLEDARWKHDSPFRQWLPSAHASVARIDGRIVQGRNLFGPQVRIEDSTIVNSVVSERVRIERGAEIVDSILLPGARVQQGAKLHRTIVEESNCVPPGMVVVRERRTGGFTSSAKGVVVWPEKRQEKSPLVDDHRQHFPQKKTQQIAPCQGQRDLLATSTQVGSH